MKGASQIAPFGLRMPEDLKTAIAERAAKNGRSMNAEIVQILEDRLSTERELEDFIIDDAQRSGGVQSLSIKDLEEIMEKTVRKALDGLTDSPVNKSIGAKNKKPT
ncbi:TPA: Arc family DNA-binding protein [Klebsiella aerogenes]|uniref:Arc family DNA-binding protein n=1 Tax=Klebsiella aerogenes TaxID=548 RepID=A0AAW9LXM6_KLEAE|nr:Arc family DNA-binding protein [Klebsiella aerogenes]MEA8802421.1 Arc family DNA-binding protein [Klebsiella aerogenes]HDG8261104.1 Arc family DNA-binding protein [Klebsiella aerogenes]